MDMQLVPAYRSLPSEIYTLSCAMGLLIRYEIPTGNKVEGAVNITKDPNVERDMMVNENVLDEAKCCIDCER
ncbi:hypothetical protein IG631_14234 [Alternaria alternata]|nr:hypothetical protein IG631_14234 [Alternaria alternata]